MAYKKITKLGEEFIRENCNGTGKSNLYGTNPIGVLPFCDPLTSPNKKWLSNPNINGGIETNDELADALIKWYNEYSKIFNLDANILAAQAYQESKFNVWIYAPNNSTASGISQFLAATIYDVIARNIYGEFTDTERMAITKNMINYTFVSGKTPPKTPFLIDYFTGRQNRSILHQNIIDNPEIMIKAQFVYMKAISKRCDKLASCTLFGYSRGLGYVKSSSYSAAINNATGKGNSYEKEGINYVYRIFKYLYDNFGYKQLNITDEAAKNFDKFNATLG